MSGRITPLMVIGIAFTSGYAISATHVADSRGNGMGNTGVASADYLVAPFYNPALTANYRDSDDVGLLLPALGVTVKDTDETLKEADDLQDTIEAFEDQPIPDASIITQLNDHLDELQGNKPLTVTANGGLAVAIPNQYVAVNIFTQGYVEVIGLTQISSYVDTGNAITDTEDRYNSSKIELAAFGYTEFGVSFAKQLQIQGQMVSLGISPKYQQLKTYYDSATVEDFDLSDYDQSEKKKNTFNLDIGAVWYKDNWQVGMAIRDLFKKDIKTQNSAIKYELTPQATVAAAYTSQFVTLAVDADLTAQTRYNNIDDDTQFVRFGVEGNAWDWLQVRAGYQIDTKDTIDNTITAGIGVSPFDVVSFDIAGSYVDENEFGGSANLAFTF